MKNSSPMLIQFCYTSLDYDGKFGVSSNTFIDQRDVFAVLVDHSNFFEGPLSHPWFGAWGVLFVVRKSSNEGEFAFSSWADCEHSPPWHLGVWRLYLFLLS